MGDWEMIYPVQDEAKQAKFDNMIKVANEIFDDFTTGKGKKEAVERKKTQGPGAQGKG